MTGRRARDAGTRAGLVRRLLLVATAATSVAVAGWGFARVLEPSAALLPVLSGAFGPAVLLAVAVGGAVLTGGRRAPSVAVTLPLSLLVGLVVGPLVASALAPGPGPVESLRAFGGTWRTLLTSTLPAAADAATVLALLLLVWFASSFAVEAALRSRSAVTALAPAVVVLAVAVAFGLPAGGSALLLAGVLAAVGAVHLAQSRVLPAPGQAEADVPAAPDRVSALMRFGTVVLVAALAAALGALAGPRLPFAAARTPFDPRVLVEPPEDTSSGLSALSRVSQWLAGPPRPLFAVDGDLRPDDRLRLVSLNAYDGTTWTAEEEYVVAGARLPAGPEVAGDVRTVTAEVGLGALPGQWLPAADRPRTLDGFRAKVAPDSGDLVSAGQPLVGGRYTVTSQVRTPDPQRLRAAGAGADPALDDLRTLPGDRPEVLATTAREAASGGTTPIHQLLLVERWMQQNLEYDPGALPGHSLGVLARFVEPGSSGAMEQFAAAYAAMARELGFASRVTVGFTPGTAAGDPLRNGPVDSGVQQVDPAPVGDHPALADPASVLGPGATTVTTRDAMAWPEVWLDGAGWVAFYPVPQPGAAQEQDVITGVGAPPDRVDLEDVTAGGQQNEEPDTDAPLEESVESLGLGLQVLLGLAAATGALALWVAAVTLWRVLSARRRRRVGTPRERLLRAWREVLVALDAAGVPRVRSLTADQVVREGTTFVGDEQADRLGSVADAARRALFSGRDVSGEDADRAWDDADVVTRAALRTRGAGSRAMDLVLPPRRS